MAYRYFAGETQLTNVCIRGAEMTFKLCLAEPLVVLTERITLTSVTGKTVSHCATTWFTYVVLPRRA